MTYVRDEPASVPQPECNNPDDRALLVSLHDVTPIHAARIERAERLLASLGISSVAYLFVPNFHGRAPAHDDAEFVAWCRARRPYSVEWVLHGYVHREDSLEAHEPSSRLTDWFARRFLTDGEGEFLSLRGRRLVQRLEAGVRSITHATGRPPEGFVAPAWLYNDELIPCLKRLHMPFTESHFHLFDLQNDRVQGAPVIAWASRSPAHRSGSLLATRVGRRLWAGQRLLRLALHPSDFDHERIVDSIVRSLDLLRTVRSVISYREVCRPRDLAS